MKFSLTSILLWPAPFALASSSDQVFRPVKISYESLLNEKSDDFDASFIDALNQVGLVSITGIFSSDNTKQETLEWLHPCAMKSEATVEHTYADGTTRRTMATRSVKGGSGHMMKHHFAKKNSDACETFNQVSGKFRSKVAAVTEVFANRLSTILESKKDEGKGPFLSTESGYTFDTLASIVENGEHLEHFHSYQKDHGEEVERNTIEWHTDQGLFLAFTPGQRAHSCHSKKDGEDSVLTDGFYIKLKDESQVMVQFDEHDDLVFLLGDGVNQYINAKLKDPSLLRATPHALMMPYLTEEQARVWYGRMVLPPSSAVHEGHGMTFGEIRQKMIEESIGNGEQEESALSLGCSGSLVARELQETTCEAGTMFCWHRCMSLAEFEVSEDICIGRNLELQCINPRRQLWDQTHGDFFPGCAESDAIVATPYEKLPDYPRNAERCTDASWDEYSSTNDYDHYLDLPDGAGNPAAVFMWSVLNNEVKGRLAFNGLFGFIALGFSNVGGGKNGMHGAEIVMALPGGNYSLLTGLDLTMEHSVDEYKISQSDAESAYRFWMEPVSEASIRSLESKSYEVDSTECFTSLTFQTDSIHSRAFNLTGEDELLWAANEEDYYVGYHGLARGKFWIDWANPELSTTNDQDDQEDPDSDQVDSSSAAIALSGMVWYALIFLFISAQF